ncbi:polyphosphate kinase [Ruminococcaceae bacterium R-25]|nr:polyphosphate kinase [Ruminococcaceae bacterium R-25]SUQ10915.1 polyphosphate kinase [Oscillospiraceae bacterium]
MAVKKNAAGRKANTTENKKQGTVKKTAKKPAEKKAVVKKSAAKKTVDKKPAVKKAASFVASPDISKADYNESSASFLSGNACFYNRELSWLEFDDRILHEARDSKNPLLERLNFLSITASNLDEFYIVRVASLRDMQSIDFAERDIAGFSIDEQLERIDQKTRRTMSLMYSTYNRSLVPSLAQEQIFLRNYDELSDQLKAIADSYFKAVLYPIITPMAVDSSRPFPLIYNRMLNMCVMLENEPKKIKLQERATDGISNAKRTVNEEKYMYATVQIPTVVKRLYQIPTEEGDVFVPVEQIIRANVDMLFNGQTVVATAFYRVMRNADLDIDEDEAEDLLKEIEAQVRRRRFGEIIRLEVQDDIESDLLHYIVNELEVDEADIFSVNGPIDLTFLSKLTSACKAKHPELCYKAHEPAEAASFDGPVSGLDIFEQIREKDRIVHHPYETFEPVLEFVKQAARDPNVLAIKQTLYRVSDRSPIIASLLEAAQNGKQVMVLVELKARFDEENNINWAKKLENAGCHVIYGLVGLKTHSKITLVVRKEEDGIRRYLHLATGNYNDVTAKIYTDLGLFTANESFGEDASEFFNMLSGFSIPQSWRRLIPAPLWMKDYFISRIRREAENARAGKPARIIAKINSLVDETVIKALYTASNAGVKIDLIVRGICCLRAGIPGMSENITVRSITGRFLEHSRIFYFYNEGYEDIYLASADWMPRNLNRRVELLFPIEDPDCRARVKEVLDVELADTVRAHFLSPDGSYHKLDLRGKEKLDSQQKLIDLADAAVAERHKSIDKHEFIPEESPRE